MYALFVPAFRQAFEIPLDYAIILQSHDMISTEERRQEWRSDPVPRPLLLASDVNMQFDLDLPEPPFLDTVATNDIPLLFNVDQGPLTVENWSLVDTEAATLTGSAPLLGTRRTCSACKRPFEKTKSHKGALCWACKKRNSRRLPPEVSSTSVEHELSVNDALFF